MAQTIYQLDPEIQ